MVRSARSRPSATGRSKLPARTARSLTELGLIDEYRIYLHPVVLGHGTPYFAGPRPPLRLMTHDHIDEDVIRLTYVPA